MENSVKAVLFDYGGTIDNFGDHWAVTLREAHKAAGLGEVSLEDFIEAYIAGERAMAKGGCVTPQSDYRHTMLVKARLELEALRSKGYGMTDAALEERAGRGRLLRCRGTPQRRGRQACARASLQEV